MTRIPATVVATLTLLGLDAVMWFAFGVYVAAGGIASIGAPAVRWVMAGLAWASAAALLALTVVLSRRVRPAFTLAIMLLGIIAALSLTDQIGLLDLAALALTVIPLLLLLKDRAWYLGRSVPDGHD